MWDRFARRLGVSDALTWGGELRWSLTESAAADMVRRCRILNEWGYAIRLMGPADGGTLEPSLPLGDARAVTFTNCDGHVETGRVVDACIATAIGLGAAVRVHQRVTGFGMAAADDGHSTVAAVITERGEIPCSDVVIAAGPDTQALAAQAGVRAPITHSFGATFVTAPVARIMQTACVVHTPREIEPQVNVRQFGDGSVMVHGGSHGGTFDGSIGRTDADVEYVMDAAAAMFPALQGVGVCEVRRGRRPLPQDGLPILGFVQTVPNLYLAAMHSGVTLAALVGEVAALEIAEDVRTTLFAPYRVERFEAGVLRS